MNSIIFLLGTGSTALLLVILYFILKFKSKKPRPPTENEKYFQILSDTARTAPAPLKNSKSNRQKEKNGGVAVRREPTPSLLVDQAKVHLSVVIPAYNESERLPNMLHKCYAYLAKQRYQYEVIVVDDGSRDNTTQVAMSFTNKYDEFKNCPPVKCLQLEKNRGKGGAVKQGMMAAAGEYILMVDADGATEFSCIQQLFSSLGKSNNAVAIGSRAHLVDSEAVVKRSFIRNTLMHAFHMVVYLLCSDGVRKIKDTQCGFKMFTRKAAASIFPSMHVEGWIFDIEVLHLACMKGMQIHECNVEWTEIEGSKMSLVRDAINMALDLLIIRLNYLLGFW